MRKDGKKEKEKGNQRRFMMSVIAQQKEMRTEVLTDNVKSPV